MWVDEAGALGHLRARVSLQGVVPLPVDWKLNFGGHPTRRIPACRLLLIGAI